MFQWKIYSYQNVNGQEKSFEKSFDNYEEYKSFMGGNNFFGNFLGSGNSFFDLYLNNFFDRKLALTGWEMQDKESWDLPVNLDRYEQEIQKIEMSEKEKDSRRKKLESAKTRLWEYKNKFETSGKKELLKELEEDMKKIDAEMKSLS